MTGRLPLRIEHAMRQKERALARLESLLDPRERREARRDHHARRKPRHCGITIHTGVGCSYGCVYCYIWDMGFPGRPKPYPLSALQIAYAIALNPYVVPGYTFAAYGSVTEPFLEETRDKAIEYIRTVYNYLALPSQVSTKSIITKELARELSRTDPYLSVLISVTGIGKNARRLEPRAPDPLERIESARILAGTTVTPTLFIRPIIPGITDKEIDEILEAAKRAKVKTIVLGTLRVTSGIVKRLSSIGVELPRNLLPKSLDEKRQRYISGSGIKKRLVEIVSRIGFIVLPSACSANVYSHRMGCSKCRLGPCGDVVPPTIGEIEEALPLLGLDNYRVVDVSPRIIRLRRIGKYSLGDEIGLFWLREISTLDIVYV